MFKFLFLIVIIQFNLFAINPKATNMAKLFVETVNQTQSSLPKNPHNIEIYNFNENNRVIIKWKENNFNSVELKKLQNKFIDYYKNTYCPVYKPIMNYDVEFNIKMYDKYNLMAYEFLLNCI